MGEDPVLLGEDVLGRIWWFLGGTLYVAVCLAAVQSFPNKDSFQGQAGSRKCGLKLKWSTAYSEKGGNCGSALHVWKDPPGLEKDQGAR